ncbi:GGDEF domain-containing protein [Silvibacterium acidisoli]|uniref:GGDEF domain-containing protein n=1 Tax=Acidobacteriaceae bacterium ZG23-2 TaxID=2883246 RepID=UPI00406CCE23
MHKKNDRLNRPTDQAFCSVCLFVLPLTAFPRFSAVLVSIVVMGSVIAFLLHSMRRMQVAAHSSEHFRTLVEDSKDVLILADMTGLYHYLSPSIAAHAGWSSDELAGKTRFEDLLHPGDAPSFAQLFLDLRDGHDDGPPLECRVRCKDGSWIWMEATISLYCDPKTRRPIGFVQVLRDISARKAAEERLHAARRALEALASVDGLTGVANRRRFDEVLDQEWRRAARSGDPLSLIIMDVDFFKAYNDLYGHVRGDHCLRQIVQATLDVIHRPADLVARYGGEEFALILPETSEHGAIDVAEKLRNSVYNRRIVHPASDSGTVTISVGVATCIPDQSASAVHLLEAADAALYRAKYQGRNRVEIFRHDPQSTNR